MKKYNELIMKLSQLNEKERLIIALFDLERLWYPFLLGTSYYTWDIQTMVRRWIDILWQGVWEEQITDSEKRELKEIIHEISKKNEEDMEEGKEYPEEVKAAYLVNHLFSHYSWFIDVNKREQTNNMEIIMSGMQDMIEDMLLDKFFPQEPGLDAEKNLGVLYEISSIEADVQLAKNYPESLKEIIKKKGEYQKQNILEKIFSEK